MQAWGRTVRAGTKGYEILTQGGRPALGAWEALSKLRQEGQIGTGQEFEWMGQKMKEYSCKEISSKP